MPIILVLFALFSATAALGQHNHDAGHSDYIDWRSQRAPQSCCNDHDCGSLKDDDVRQTATGPEVKVGGDWCPVLPEHYLTRGKSPGWSVAHACIDRKSTRLNSSHVALSRMPSSA